MKILISSMSCTGIAVSLPYSSVIIAKPTSYLTSFVSPPTLLPCAENFLLFHSSCKPRCFAPYEISFRVRLPFFQCAFMDSKQYQLPNRHGTGRAEYWSNSNKVYPLLSTAGAILCRSRCKQGRCEASFLVDHQKGKPWLVYETFRKQYNKLSRYASFPFRLPPYFRGRLSFRPAAISELKLFPISASMTALGSGPEPEEDSTNCRPCSAVELSEHP